MVAAEAAKVAKPAVSSVQPAPALSSVAAVPTMPSVTAATGQAQVIGESPVKEPKKEKEKAKEKKKKTPSVTANKPWDASESKKSTARPAFEDAPGRFIAVSDGDGDIRGRVVGGKKKMLQIRLLDEEGNEDDEVLELQYNSPNIRWYQDK